MQPLRNGTQITSRLEYPTPFDRTLSFLRSAWECSPGRSAAILEKAGKLFASRSLRTLTPSNDSPPDRFHRAFDPPAGDRLRAAARRRIVSRGPSIMMLFPALDSNPVWRGSSARDLPPATCCAMPEKVDPAPPRPWQAASISHDAPATGARRTQTPSPLSVQHPVPVQNGPKNTNASNRALGCDRSSIHAPRVAAEISSPRAGHDIVSLDFAVGSRKSSSAAISKLLSPILAFRHAFVFQDVPEFPSGNTPNHARGIRKWPPRLLVVERR
jgi:hypothetical protein